MNKELQDTVAVMAPKAQVYDAIVADDELVPFRDTASMLRKMHGLRVTEPELRKKCLAEKWIYKNKEGEYKIYKATAIDGGFMEYKELKCNDGRYRPCKHFTPKGIRQLIEWFKPKTNLF